MKLRFDTRQQTVLNIIENGVVLNDSKVLGLGLVLLIRILARAAHHWVGSLLRLHLLSNLRGYGGC